MTFCNLFSNDEDFVFVHAAKLLKLPPIFLYCHQKMTVSHPKRPSQKHKKPNNSLKEQKEATRLSPGDTDNHI